MAIDVSRLNKLELEKLHLISDYVNTMTKLESHLNESRLWLSKTKSIVGFSNAAAGLVDLRDMEAVVRVQFDATKEEFALDLGNGDELPEENGVVNRKQKSKKVEQLKIQKNYKPFGELEPLSAKQTRAIAEKSILLACELATIQRKIIKK